MSPIEQLLKIIAPFSCVRCGVEGALLCARCREALPTLPPRCYRCNRASASYRTCAACRPHSSLSQVWARTPYEDPAKQVIHRLKFERAQAAARDIAAAMAGMLPADSCEIITYVPTASSRVRLRGYDQAQLIAKELARLQSVPCASLLVRAASARQVGQGRAVRLEQMQHAFRAVHTNRFQKQRVLLVDDVITTGATCEAAAQALRQAGASTVSAAVFAAA
jgi:ComF family protein